MPTNLSISEILAKVRIDSMNAVQTPAESRRREAAVNFARSSVGLEGFKPSKDAETRARQFIKGEIHLADFIKVKPDANKANSR